ncbi:hypothetical protein FBU59_002882 [Linderina macrospora]|uniref:Uncharacterized protein n=1 Tax=Linderina macrospora TaxID=4868 RepID=A0ACC1J9X7_9FUNG|nr:hypothetical protein FBU59_002882 [Linderina macrospora]
MLSALALFLRTELEPLLSGKLSDNPIASQLLQELDEIELASQSSLQPSRRSLVLPQPKHRNASCTFQSETDRAPPPKPPIAIDFTLTDSVLAKIQQLANRHDDTHICWLTVFIGAALVHGLKLLVLSDASAPLDAPIRVLNDLDRAIVVAGASGQQLEWIYKVRELVESSFSPALSVPEQPKNTPVDVIPELSDLEFPVKTYAVDDMDMVRFLTMVQDTSSSVPFIIQGAISFWSALTTRKWADLEYLRSAVGHHRLVPVELGARYTDSDWSQQLMPFGDYLDQLIYPSQCANPPEVGYLAQHNLFTQASRLKRDFSLPDYTQIETGRRAVPEDSVAGSDGVLVNAWLGPRGTVSPLHFDKYDNVFAQVVGYKYLRFYAPGETENVYPFPPGSALCNTSQVDVNEPDLQRFALFSQARYLECYLGPGDLLYLPVCSSHTTHSHTRYALEKHRQH